MNCSSQNTTIDHSNPDREPEMFAVYGKSGVPHVECLAHAQVSESRGRRAEVIPSWALYQEGIVT